MFRHVFNYKAALTLLLGFLLLAGSLGTTHQMSMDGDMADCPFAPGISLCVMSPLEMIAASQSFLSGIILNADSSVVFLLAPLAFMATAFFSFFSPPRLAARLKIRKQSPPLRFSFLAEAFSSGLLNPKLYV